MSGIAGTDVTADDSAVRQALAGLSHRGPQGSRLVRSKRALLGQVWPEVWGHLAASGEGLPLVLDGEIHNWCDLCPGATSPLEALAQAYAESGPAFVSHLDGHFALAIAGDDGIFLARDPVGVVPLYFSDNGSFSFASEVKALCSLAREAEELPPGHYYAPGQGLVQYAAIERAEPLDEAPESLAQELRHLLVAAIAKRLNGGPAGSWLSGGLDSSAIASLARRQVGELHTFAVGFDGAEDVHYARIVADHIGSHHHERLCTREDLLAALPQVIYHLESFDALLVRSSLTNYLVGQLAAEHVPMVFSGEGGDELFAGYDYLRDIQPDALPAELVDITRRLHNTALQRVDRCSRAHGLIAHVPFLDQDVLDFALRVPSELKLNREAGMVAKWILRLAAADLLPREVVERPKAKFWEGAGVQRVLGEYAETEVSDAEFEAERGLPNGQTLNSKEELMYFRLFCEHFGDLADASFVGRTKGATPES